MENLNDIIIATWLTQLEIPSHFEFHFGDDFGGNDYLPFNGTETC